MHGLEAKGLAFVALVRRQPWQTRALSSWHFAQDARAETFAVPPTNTKQPCALARNIGCEVYILRPERMAVLANTFPTTLLVAWPVWGLLK